MRLTKFVVLFMLVQNGSCLFKMTNVKCEVIDKSWVVVKECRLKALRRDVSVLNVVVEMLQPAYKVTIDLAVLKKANGYKPFLYNFTFDACEYLEKRNNPVVNLIYDLFKDYTSLNHTCPYMGQQFVKGFYPRHEVFNLPMPNGEYALSLIFNLNKFRVFGAKVFFIFTEKTA